MSREFEIDQRMRALFREIVSSAVVNTDPKKTADAATELQELSAERSWRMRPRVESPLSRRRP